MMVITDTNMRFVSLKRKMTLARRGGLVFFVIFQVCAFAQVPAGYEPGLEKINSKELRKHVEFLAADSMKGRAAGSKENLLAAMYIAKNFRDAGLKPFKNTVAAGKIADEDYSGELSINDGKFYDGYFQKFNIQKVKLLDSICLVLQKNISGGNLKLEYKYGKDFFVSYTGSENISVAADIVFAGYGIENGENGYNDYQSGNGGEIDVRGKIVVIVDSHPKANDPNSAFSKSNKPEYRVMARKVEIAKHKGALAVLVVQSPLLNEDPIGEEYKKIFEQFSREHFKLHDQIRNSIPVFYLSNKIAWELFSSSSAGTLKKVLQEIEFSEKPDAFNFTDLKTSFDIKLENGLFQAQNVIGFLQGSDPALKDEVVLICGHYDHIGMGYHNSMKKEYAGQIHNGADDNASGTAGVMELAKAFSQTKPGRSILFVSFSAEETGLLGSKYYVEYQPVFPIEKTVACINLDMIGRNNENYVWLVGAFQGRDIINTSKIANEKIGMELLYNVGLYSRASDQAFFLNRKIPSVLFFAGEHEDYHTPFDDVEKINFTKAERITKLAYLTGWILANQEKTPVYEDIQLKEREEMVKESIARIKKNKQTNHN